MPHAEDHLRLDLSSCQYLACACGGDIFHKIEPGYCDGMRVDEYGNIWSSAADGVHCIGADGELPARPPDQ